MNINYKDHSNTFEICIDNETWTLGYCMMHYFYMSDNIESISCDVIEVLDKEVLIVTVQLKEFSIDKSRTSILECCNKLSDTNTQFSELCAVKLK